MGSVVNAQPVRGVRGNGNSGTSRDVSRNASPSFNRESRPDARSSNNNRSYSSAMQRQTPSREMTYRQVPERTSRTQRTPSSVNSQSRNNTQRVFSEPGGRNSANERLIVSRNNSNNVTRNSYFDRNRAVSRNTYRNNYRDNYYNTRYSSNRYGYRYHYYGTVYGHRTRFIYGPRYRVIPHNFISIHFGGYPYYYYDGFYYGYYGGYYEPIFPPIGLRIGFLPYGYSSIFIGGYPYYYYNGIYYRHYDDGDYEVVDPPMGANVYSLPKGAKSVILNGEKLYELNGTYYKEGRNSKGEVIYTVVGKNGEINNTEDDGAMQNNVPQGNNDVDVPPVSLQMGDVVTQLPEGSKVATINGEKLYVAPDDTYLREETNGGTVQYKVVGVGR